MTQLVSGAINAFGSILSGQSKQTQYNRKAADARLSGRITGINLQLKAAQLLGKVNGIMATSLARSMVGGGSTSVAGPQMGTLKHGVRDYSIIKDNIDIQMGRAESQAQDYLYAGELAVTSSYIEAMASLAGGHARQSELGYPDFGSTAPTAPGGGVTFTTSGSATAGGGNYTGYGPGYTSGGR